ncbi:MAG TPA: 50S ribosomal protein L4 [Polyangia bacterium]|nr:50S ribosomal protein L4 [Polyangia bacterium]
MKIDVLDLSGAKVGSMDLDDAVFGAAVKEHLLWEVVKAQRASRRAGTHATRTQAHVAGGGKKPWRQKGTGRARQGSIRAAQWVGGGTVFGPHPRDYSYEPPKKVRKGALRAALSLRAQEKRLLVVKEFKLDQAKTRLVAAALKALGLEQALIVDGRENHDLSRAARNLKAVKFLPHEGLNVYDILRYQALVVTQPAARALNERLRPPRAAAAAGKGA